MDDYFALVPIRARQNAEKAVGTRTLAKQASDRLYQDSTLRRLFTAYTATFSYSSLLAAAVKVVVGWFSTGLVVYTHNSL